MSVQHFAQALLASAFLLPAFTSCSSSGGDEQTQTAPTVTVDDLISGIALAGEDGAITVESGNAPAGSAAGAVIQFAGGGTVAQGSTSQSTLSSLDALDAVIIRLGGVNGFYQIALEDSSTAFDILLSLSANAPAGAVDCICQGRREGETMFGEPITVPIEILNVGSGELQINLTWNTDADLDLHLFEPDGTQIFYGNTTSSTGGQLDLDANVGCGNVGVENIFYNQVPPVGQYRVAVDNFSQCSMPESNYVVTVTLPGQDPMVLNGMIAPSDGLMDVFTFDL